MKEAEPVKRTNIGGQAVIEGVMMRGKSMYAMAVRTPDKTIEIVEEDLHPAGEKYPILKLPICRGIVSFVESLTIGMKILTLSAEMAGLEDEETPREQKGKFERFLDEKLGDKQNDVIMTISVVLAMVLAVGLFMLLPVWIGSVFSGILRLNEDDYFLLGLIEGMVRIGIFIIYVVLISRAKDIRRVFQYHGAEHKTISCFESGLELTVENARGNSRLHKRCGSSFLMFVMIISLIVFIFVRTNVIWLRLLSRIILIPLIAGISYEVIKWAGRSDSKLVSIISYPGLCLQRLTTAEPDDDQLEVAIAAMKKVLAREPE